MDQHKIRTTNWETYIHLVKGNIGTGCLALPFCFSMLGPGWSIVGLSVTGVFCVYNMWLIVDCKKRVAGATTYGELGYVAFGNTGELIVELFLSMMQLSICCVYFTFIGSNISSLLTGGGSLYSQNIIVLLLIIPIAWIAQIKSIRQLAPLTLAATALLCVALLCIFTICFSNIFSDQERPPVPVADFGKLISFFCVTIYSFEGIGIILPIEDAMERPSDFLLVLSASMATVAVIFVCLAEVSIFAYGNIDEGSMTSFLMHHAGGDPTSLTATVITSVNLLISFAVLLTYPLQLYPAVQILELTLNLVEHRQSPHAVTSERSCTPSTRGVPRSKSDLSFFNAHHSPVFKKIRKSERVHKQAKAIRRKSYFSIAREGDDVDEYSESRPAAVLPGLLQQAQNIIGGEEDEVHSGSNAVKVPAKTTQASRHTLPAASLKEIRASNHHYSVQVPRSQSECLSAYRYHKIPTSSRSGKGPTGGDSLEPLPLSGEVAEDSICTVSVIGPSEKSLLLPPATGLTHALPFGLDKQTVFRTCLVAATAIVAIVVPDIGLLIALAGATSGATLSMVLPPMIDWQISTKPFSMQRRVLNCMSVIIGILGTVIGTVVAVMDIIHAYF